MADDPLDEIVNRGKYTGATWAQVIERDPSYAMWAADEWTLPMDLRDAIRLSAEESQIEHDMEGENG